jgi:hypothetical protein
MLGLLLLGFRIPGTLNSIYISSDDDEKSEIQIAQTWDSDRPKIDTLQLIELPIYLGANSG